MHDSRPPLLYLTHRIPYPPNKGDKVRSFNILRQLARTHRVWLGTFVDHPDDHRHIPALKQWCEQTCVIPIEPGIRRIASLRGLLQGEALSLPYYRNPRLADWVERAVAEHGITRAVAFSGPMAQYLGAHGLARRVVDFCDVDSAKWTQYAADRRWPMSWLYRREGERLLAFERVAAADCDACLFVTEAEADLFRAAAPELSTRGASLGPWTDIYSLGAAMLACMSCSTPQSVDARRAGAITLEGFGDRFAHGQAVGEGVGRWRFAEAAGLERQLGRRRFGGHHAYHLRIQAQCFAGGDHRTDTRAATNRHVDGVQVRRGAEQFQRIGGHALARNLALVPLAVVAEAIGHHDLALALPHPIDKITGFKRPENDDEDA